MPAKFVLHKDKAGKFRFNLLAANGQVVATSQGYATKVAAHNGIRSVRRNAPEAPIDDQTVPAAPPAKAPAPSVSAVAPAPAAESATAKPAAAKTKPKAAAKPKAGGKKPPAKKKNGKKA